LNIFLGPYLTNHPTFKQYHSKQIKCASQVFAEWNRKYQDLGVPKYPPKALFEYRWKMFQKKMKEHKTSIAQQPHVCFVCRKFFKTQRRYDCHTTYATAIKAHDKYESEMEQVPSDSAPSGSNSEGSSVGADQNAS